MNIWRSPTPMLLAAVDLDYPFAYVLGVLVLLGLIVEACRLNRRAWCVPCLLVYATVGAWYFSSIPSQGPTTFLMKFGPAVTNQALYQTILFLVAYRVAVQYLLPHRNVPEVTASVASRFPPGILTSFLFMLAAFWLVLFVAGLARAEWQLAAILWPPVSGAKVGMFSRGGIGQGTDFLVSTGGYLYVVVCASFGVLAILARGLTRWIAGALFVFVSPYFFFDHARSNILALTLPSVFCYLVSTWGQWWKKALVGIVFLLALELWFGQVMHSRGDSGENRTTAMLEFVPSEEGEGGLLGLDMFSELCYIDTFVQNGDYRPNWGQRYLAELANAVPRALWSNKPLIGYDYAYARGFRDASGSEEDAVYATISTGMIGQGISNFGRFFGVIAAALLMTGWTAILSKLWLRRYELPRFLLFSVGCGLTFNLGRDITLLVLWPFVFAYGLVRLLEWFQPKGAFAARRTVPVRRLRRAGAPGLPHTP